MTHRRAAVVTLLAIMIAAFTLTATAQPPAVPDVEVIGGTWSGMVRHYDPRFKVACYSLNGSPSGFSCVKVGP